MKMSICLFQRIKILVCIKKIKKLCIYIIHENTFMALYKLNCNYDNFVINYNVFRHLLLLPLFIHGFFIHFHSFHTFQFNGSLLRLNGCKRSVAICKCFDRFISTLSHQVQICLNRRPSSITPLVYYQSHTMSIYHQLGSSLF